LHVLILILTNSNAGGWQLKKENATGESVKCKNVKPSDVYFK